MNIVVMLQINEKDYFMVILDLMIFSLWTNFKCSCIKLKRLAAVTPQFDYSINWPIFKCAYMSFCGRLMYFNYCMPFYIYASGWHVLMGFN